ncbi:MAG TPA: glucokinase [Xanthobacteraceae bacterium]|nr:glucokinase [Xanthobacteraceae bacterium]
MSKKAFDVPTNDLVQTPKTQRRILLGDIGATNARFAELTDGRLGHVTSFEVARFPKFEDALRTYLSDHASARGFTQGLLAVAGPIDHGRATLTNTSWLVEPSDLKASFGFDVQVVNDFQAVAYSLPSLVTADLVQISQGKAEKGAPKVALGPGSGLGVACLVEYEGECLVIPSEGGHASLAGNSDREDAVIKVLRRRFGHASAERAISGPGLENIYQAMVTLDGLDMPSMNAAQITQRALNNECKLAYEALGTFCALLGSFAGSAALTFGGRGGVYIAGGISPRIVEFLARSQFRARFEGKGRFQGYLEQIPSYVIVHPAAAFLGLKFRVEHP